MVKKYDLVKELYISAIKEVMSSPENWKSFLKSACHNYRLPFDEQLLVYAQRSDATAVLEMESWNTKFGRWVKKGSKAIAVLDKNSGTPRLKYYFDISDTQEGRYRRLVRPVPVWEVKEEHYKKVQETLSHSFHVLQDTGFTDSIQEAAKNAAGDSMDDCLEDILSSRKGSLLENWSEKDIEVEIKNLLAESISYLVMLRCGIDTETYYGDDSFKGITRLSSFRIMNLFGVAVSDTSERVLIQIADTVKKLTLADKEDNRIFAGGKTSIYNESRKTNTDSERSFEDDDNTIQHTGGLLNLKITYTYSLLIHCLQIPRRNQTIQKRSFCI